MRSFLLTCFVLLCLGCQPKPQPKPVKPRVLDPWPQGTVLVSRNPRELDNTTPGYWNHLAIYLGNYQLVEAQAGQGVIQTSNRDYNARGCLWYPLFPRDTVVGQEAARFAQTLVGLPYRADASLLGDRDPVRGVNCVSVVRLSYEHALGYRLPELKLPDDAEHLVGAVFTTTNPKNAPSQAQTGVDRAADRRAPAETLPNARLHLPAPAP